MKRTLVIGEKIKLDTLPSRTALTVLLTLSTLEGESEALPSPLPVNNVVRLFKLLLENNKLRNFNF